MRIAGLFFALVKLIASLFMLVGVVWACGALWFQLAGTVKSGSARGLILGVWVGVGLYSTYLLWQNRVPKALLIYGVLFAAILAWWATIAPSNTRQWAPDVAQQLSGTISGNTAQLHLMDGKGQHQGSVDVVGAQNIDWEDLASFELDGRQYLAVAITVSAAKPPGSSGSGMNKVAANDVL